jgi:hypothetical protein
MKTPMQELIDKINNEEFDHLDDCKMFIQEYMLEKEREVMCEFAWEYERECRINLNRSIEDCWDKFNTEEK